MELEQPGQWRADKKEDETAEKYPQIELEQTCDRFSTKPLDMGDWKLTLQPHYVSVVALLCGQLCLSEMYNPPPVLSL